VGFLSIAVQEFPASLVFPRITCMKQIIPYQEKGGAIFGLESSGNVEMQ
jgi:hypothetical protein